MAQIANTLSSQEIDSTVNVMRSNINKVSERGERLDSLQDKTDNLAVSAQGFRRGANRVRKQMWWKDMKMRMCLIVGIIILLIVIIVPSGESIPAVQNCAGEKKVPCQAAEANIQQWLLPSTKRLPKTRPAYEIRTPAGCTWREGRSNFNKFASNDTKPQPLPSNSHLSPESLLMSTTDPHTHPYLPS